MAKPAPPVSAVDRFATAVTALAGASDNLPLALAVSGGGDSLALMWLAAHSFAGHITVLSVDHGLRLESATECLMVAGLARELGLPHHTLKLATLPPGPGMQARARQARYQVLGAWCALNRVPFLLTAHHVDDQAETLLLRLRRGSGLAGLAGIRPRNILANVGVLRPLLDWRRAELHALLPTHWRPADDPSNHDPHYDRTHARALLAREPWLQPAPLAASAAHLADAEEALSWAAERAFASRATPTATGWRIDIEALPIELQRRVLAQAIASFGSCADGSAAFISGADGSAGLTSGADGSAVARLVQRLNSGGSGTLGGAWAKAHTQAGIMFWEVTAAPPRKISQADT